MLPLTREGQQSNPLLGFGHPTQGVLQFLLACFAREKKYNISIRPGFDFSDITSLWLKLMFSC